jgi:protein phosphatase
MAHQPPESPSGVPPHAAPPPVVVRSHGRTDRGKVRPANEDHFLIAELARTLWVHQTSLPQQPHTQYGFSNLHAADAPEVLKDFQAALRRANEEIFAETAHHPEHTGMGTTLTMAFASNWELFVIHAGDSRCYLHRKGQLRQLTQDHTVTAEMVRHGLLRPEQAARHQFRHVVTNVLGGPEANVHGEVQRLDLEAGDAILLCSDGLTDMLPDERIAAILGERPDPEAACTQLVAEANDRGGRDNVTVLIARFDAD